jgi:RNA polymerase sigma factor (sigma-70 family)
VEASAIHVPAGALGRRPLALPLLRLRSDEQLLALFRAGHDEAFHAIHDRYRQRLFAYVRQMLCAGPRQDAEDVLQDVFVRAYGALRADSREVNVRAWLYRVAHNRCIDHLRRPVPPAVDVFDLSRKPLHDPIDEAQRREDLARLVQDIGRLPEQQRSALLMRELDGMSYADLAGALDVSVPAVKSLLVRARIGLVEAAEARDADCCEIRADLLAAYDRGVKASSRARRHMRGCEACSEYRVALRGMRRSFAALSPVAAGPLAVTAAKLLGLGGAGGGAAAGGSAAASGGAAAVGGVAACKVAAVVCTAALTAAGGAVEVSHLAREHRPAAKHHAAAKPPAPVRPRAHTAVASAPPATFAPERTALGGTSASDAPKPAEKAPEPLDEQPAPATPSPAPETTPVDDETTPPGPEAAGATPTPAPAPSPEPTPPPSDSGTAPDEQPPPGSDSAQPSPAPSDPGPEATPTQP